MLVGIWEEQDVDTCAPTATGPVYAVLADGVGGADGEPGGADC